MSHLLYNNSMRINPKRNEATYNLTTHTEEPPVHGDYQKGVFKNLREQSPFKEGTRNKDWVNPTLSSNVLFYNHGNEIASNHHIQPQKVNKKGYNLNHYVGYDVDYRPQQQQRTVSPPPEPASDRLSTDGRRNQNAPSTSQHSEAEAPRGSAQERPRSPVTSDQRIAVERERSRSPNDGKVNVKGTQKVQLQERAVDIQETKQRPASPIHQEQRSSSRIERQYDRSQRSASSSNLQATGGLNKSASQQNIANTQQSSNENRQAVNKQQQSTQQTQTQGMTRSQSAVAMPGQYGEYLRATASNISNPDALVCDYCVNNSLHNIKVENANAYRRQEVEHAKAVQEELKRQVEEERRRQFEKLRAYQGQIDAQKRDQEEQQLRDREFKNAEDRKIRNMIEENNKTDWERAQRAYDNKQKYIQELNDQMAKNYEARQQKYIAEETANHKNPNLLINDADRIAHRMAVNENYKRNIKAQLEDQIKDKEGKREAERAENDAYRKKVQEMISKDIEARRLMEKQKRNVFVNEVERHLQAHQELKAGERDAKQIDLENLKIKQAQDRAFEIEKSNQKRAQMSDYIKTLGNQIAHKEAEKQARQASDRLAVNGTLMIPHKVDKCYNCARCRQVYPLKLLNKHKKLGRLWTKR